jgi:Tol biopolymer transport system component
VEVATGKTQVLSAGPWNDHQPTVSPDGRYVAFVSTRGGTPEVWLLGPDGGVAQVSDDEAPDWQPMFLPVRR